MLTEGLDNAINGLTANLEAVRAKRHMTVHVMY